MNRRSFLKALLAAGVTPVVARSELLLQITQVLVPHVPRSVVHTLYGDGVRDDTAAINSLLAGNSVVTPEGRLIVQETGILLPVGTYAISGTLRIRHPNTMILDSVFKVTVSEGEKIIDARGVNNFALIGCVFDNQTDDMRRWLLMNYEPHVSYPA